MLTNEHLISPFANPMHTTTQEDFRKAAKKAMVDDRITVTALARKLRLNRNTVNLAINQGMFKPTQKKIAKTLKLNV